MKASAAATARVAVAVLLACLACARDDAAAPVPDEAAPLAEAEAADPAAAGSVEPPLGRRTVEIYFPSAEGDGLVGESREIFDTATPGDRAKQIVADLISGPSHARALRAVSPGTRLRQVFVLGDGTAYLDFSIELTEPVSGGSMSEMLTVYAIVDSVAHGVREIKRVAILVNGRPIETINGHMDLRRPIKPNYKWILGSVEL